MGRPQGNAAKRVADTSPGPWKKWTGLSRADRAIKFIETYCRAPKGKGHGEQMRLAEFQKDFIRKILADGIDLAVLGTPRGNGKSTFGGALAIGALTFRHIPSGAAGEIAGHLHPVARVSHRGRAVSRRCFATDARCMVMPAFGAYAGGLNVRDAAFADLFGTLAFTAHMLGDQRLYAFPARHCMAD